MPIWQAMQTFTDTRDEASADEIWLVEHEPVFTQGQAGKDEHLLMPGDIPVVKVDREILSRPRNSAVVLFNLRRLKIGTRPCYLARRQYHRQFGEYGIDAGAKKDAPGVYVNDAKIASLGLRVSRLLMVWL